MEIFMLFDASRRIIDGEMSISSILLKNVIYKVHLKNVLRTRQLGLSLHLFMLADF